MAIRVNNQAWIDLMKSLRPDERYMIAFLASSQPLCGSYLNSATRTGGDYRGVGAFLQGHVIAGNLERINPAFYEITEAGRQLFTRRVGFLLRYLEG